MTKKITFLLSLCFVCSQFIAAQTYLSENFDGGTSIPAGWATGDNGIGANQSWFITNAVSNSAPNAAVIVYENVPTGQAEDWLITPLINLAGSTNAALTFQAAQTYGQDYGSTYEVKVSTTSQTNQASFTTVATWNENTLTANAGSNGFSLNSVDLSAYNGQQIYVAFVMTNDDGDNFILDDVTVKNLLNRDAMMTSINIPSAIVSGNTLLTGTITNEGANNITSVDISWQVDGGNMQTETLSGLNIATNENYSFQLTNTWNATAGSHTINMSTSNVNGMSDQNTANDNSSKTINVASNSVQRKVLYEQFTSSTCGPCNSVNSSNFTQAFLNSHAGEHTLVKYQVNWPGAGDPYYTAEVGERVSYYGTTGAPTIYLDGRDDVEFPYPQTDLESDINAKVAIPSFMSITPTHTINNTTVNVSVDVMPYVGGNYTLHVAVVEKTTTGNVATNGETSFEHVMMKMLPNASGTQVTFTDQTPYQISLSADISGTNVEEMNDLDVVVFIQDDSSKQIMQSAYSSESLSIDDITDSSERVKVSPNPTTGLVYILSEEKANISLYDAIGKMVFTQKDVSQEKPVDLSHLPSGVYFVTIEKDNLKEVEKLIIK